MSDDTPPDPLDVLADKVWGSGNWELCDWCLDGLGQPSRHHVNFHKGQRALPPHENRGL